MNTRSGTFYLIARPGRSTFDLSFDMRSKKPRTLRDGGVPIKVEVTLPSSLFERPQLSAKVVVDPGRVTPMEVSADVVNNIEETIRAQTGIDLRIEVANDE